MITNDSPLVSVIVPIFNVEKYIDECIQSILYQTYINLEIILVDDESPDKCPEICDDYAKQDSRIRVIHKKNEGLGYARNSGLDIATGDFVVFVDSDDYLDKNTIQLLMSQVISNNAQYVKSGFRKINDAGKISYQRQYENIMFTDTEIDKSLSPRLLGSSPSKSDSIEMSVWASIYDRSIIEKHNIRFDSERVVISEDLPFNLSFLSYCKKAVLIHNITYNYRYNPNSLTQKYRSDKFLKIVAFFEIIESRFPELLNRENVRFSRLFFFSSKQLIKKAAINKEANVKENISSIKRICNNPMTIRRINSYPIDKLPLKQQIFIRLAKGKQAIILYLLAKFNFY